jgi:peptidoglycan-N-acetylglucosamine deacetylase
MKSTYNIIKCIVFSGILACAGSAAMAAGSTITSIKTNEKVIALTFDDGPTNPYTSEILNILKKHDVKATFFVVGENVQGHHDLLKRIMDEGHEIGNHTWNHPMLKFKSADFARKQIESTDKVIRDLGYTGQIHFRSPYGVRTKTLPGVLASMDKDLILWNIDTVDWRRPASGTIAKRIINQARPGSIVLMHDGGGKRNNTVAALDTVITDLSGKGYSFVTVQQLLDMRSKAAPVEAVSHHKTGMAHTSAQ